MHNEFYVAFFDILGFKNRLCSMGLTEMLSRYEALIGTVTFLERSLKRVFGDFGFVESPHWSNDGEVFLVTKTRGAYASDSLLIWEHRFWPEVRDMSNAERIKAERTPATAWQFEPIPPDNFLKVCNELMCKGVEVGLPLRGGIAIGNAVLDLDKNIFLGQPIIDAAQLQSKHNMMSTSFYKSIDTQLIPKRFAFKYNSHTKEGFDSISNGLVLDWPRHWRNTRKSSLADAIKALDTNPEFSFHYQNTLELSSYSEQYIGLYENLNETSIRNNYEQFSWTNHELSVAARAVKNIPI